MNSQTLAHRFFYNRELRGQYNGVNTHFHDASSQRKYPTYYSYATPIAFIRKDKRGNDCLILTSHRYSVTTSKHVSELRAACTFNMYCVPDIGTVFTYKKDFKERLEYYKEQGLKSLKLAQERHDFMDFLNMYDTFNALVEELPLGFLRKCRTIKEMETLCVEKSKQLAERKKLLAEKATKEAKLMLDRVLNDRTDVLVKLKCVYGSPKFMHSLTESERKDWNELRNTFRRQRDSQGRNMSFVCPDGDKCKTSQGISVETSRVIVMLKAWKRKQRIPGEQIGIYTIVESNDEVVKVGCHAIPLWNVQALYDKLVAQ